jgi:asparagine N-glycosylation enzyme membrane subunit Stt3
MLPITGKFITVFPVLFLALTFSMLFENLIYHLPLNWWNPIGGSLLGLPIFLIIREWEDRFIVKSGIKLKV